MLTCPFCNKNFKNKQQFASHLGRVEKNKFNSELEKEFFLSNFLYGEESVQNTLNLYKNKELCSLDITTSEINIIKLITLLGIKRTSKEERATDRYKTKYLNSIQRIYGANITNISQVPEIRKKIEETCSIEYGSYEKYLEEQRKCMLTGYTEYVGTETHYNALDKAKETCLEKYGNSNFGQGASAREKSHETRMSTIATWSEDEKRERTSAAREVGNKWVSKPEKRIKHCITELSIDFMSNKHLWHYNFDIVFDKFIIEVQGDYWHANPLFYKADDLIKAGLLAKDLWKKDETKKKKAEDNGYKMIYIWENEITNKSDAELLITVKSKLMENGYEFH